MRRVILVSVGALYGCLGAGQEGLEPNPDAFIFDAGNGDDQPFFVAGTGCGGEAGDPQHLVHMGIWYQRPTCDLEAMNRPSTAPGQPLRGTDTPTPELATVAQLMVGHWHGTETTPWDGTHELLLNFDENGRYSGTATDSALFYYFESCAYHREFWRLEYGSRALAFGQLQVASEFGGCSLTEMRRIQVDDKTLRFEVWNATVYGPMVVDLQRVEATP